MASIQDIDEKKEVEVSKEVVSAGVDPVTIALESGASLMASRLFPTGNLVTAIDQPVFFLSNRVAALGGLGARIGLYGVLRWY
jgi:hypothetical protein